MHMKNSMFTLIALTIFLILPVFATETDRHEVMMERMFGFRYPLDSGGNYKVGWTRWNLTEIKSDFQKIRTSFPKVNLLRIPIDWYEMNETLPLNLVESVIDLGKDYGFKFMFVLFNRLGGNQSVLTPQNYMQANWTDHENRLSYIVNHFKDEKQIYAWALENEANVFQQIVVEWYRHFIPYIKSLDSDTPVCTSFYFLGLNSSTLSRSQDLVSFGLDFIEFHWYPTQNDNVSAMVNEFCGYVSAPLFLSEFSVHNGLDTYEVNTSKRILKDVLVECEQRLNVIGVSYYRWSDDTDPYTIWNHTTQASRAEAETLNTYGPTFLNSPYCHLEKVEATNVNQHSIYDPSFQRLAEWPNTKGWTSWHNHTAYDLSSVTTSTREISEAENVNFSNYGFENGSVDWLHEPQGNQKWAIVTNVTYHKSNALKMWTDGSDDNQLQHAPVNATPKYAYILEGWINVASSSNGAYAFLQIACRDSVGSWLRWNESEYINTTRGWTKVYAATIVPEGTVDVMINCRVRGNSGSIEAYFDDLSLRRVAPCSYDGQSLMLAWGEGADADWSVVQLSQNLTFPNPAEDAKKIWCFSCKVAAVQSPEYVTDLKGVRVQLVFTTENPNEWISWYDGEYLSFNNAWTSLNVSAIPPANAKGLHMIIKTAHSNWGVLWVDDASLTSKPAIIPTSYSIANFTGSDTAYRLTLNLESVKATSFTGSLYCGKLMITDANCAFNESSFSAEFNNTTTLTIAFTIGAGSIENWTLFWLILGLFGLLLLIVALVIMIKKVKEKKYEWLIYSSIMIALGIAFVTAWLWR